MNCLRFAGFVLLQYVLAFFVGKVVGQFLVPFGVLKTLAAVAISLVVFLAALYPLLGVAMMFGGGRVEPWCSKVVDDVLGLAMMMVFVFYVAVIGYFVWLQLAVL